MAIKAKITEAEIEAARQRGAEALKNEPRASAASYDPSTGDVRVQLTNGCSFSFPADALDELHGASPAARAAVEVPPSGYGLRWPQVDAAVALTGILQVVLGTFSLSTLGRAGGSVKSEAKAAAARANGAKGGRPRKKPAAN